MAREKKTPEADAADTAERRFTGAYYRYDGAQRGSLIDPRSGEPLGRVTNGLIVEATDAEHAHRLEQHGQFAKTTKAKWQEQQKALGLMDDDGNEVAAETPVSDLDPSLTDSGVFTDAAERIGTAVNTFSQGAQAQIDAASQLQQAGTATATTPQGGTE